MLDQVLIFLDFSKEKLFEIEAVVEFLNNMDFVVDFDLQCSADITFDFEEYFLMVAVEEVDISETLLCVSNGGI